MKLINIEYFLEHLEEMKDSWDNLGEEDKKIPEIAFPILILSELAEFVINREQSFTTKDMLLTAISNAHLSVLNYVMYKDVKFEDIAKISPSPYDIHMKIFSDEERHKILLLSEIPELKRWMRKVFTGIVFTPGIKRKK